MTKTPHRLFVIRQPSGERNHTAQPNNWSKEQATGNMSLGKYGSVFSILKIFGVIPRRSDAQSFWKSLGARNIVLWVFLFISIIRTLAASTLNPFEEENISTIVYRNNALVEALGLALIVFLMTYKWKYIEVCAKNIESVDETLSQGQLKEIRSKGIKALSFTIFVQIISFTSFFVSIYFADEEYVQESLPFFIEAHFFNISFADKNTHSADVLFGKLLIAIPECLYLSMECLFDYIVLGFVMICMLLVSQQDAFNARVARMRIGGVTRSSLADVFQKHTEILRAVDSVEQCFSTFLLLYILYDFMAMISVFNLSFMFMENPKGKSSMLFYASYLIHYCFQLLVVVHFCSRIHEKGQLCLPTLDRALTEIYQLPKETPSVPPEVSAIEVMHLYQKDNQNPMAITCAKFFVINRAFLSSLLIGCFSYVMMIYQMRSKPNCNCIKI